MQATRRAQVRAVVLAVLVALAGFVVGLVVSLVGLQVLFSAGTSLSDAELVLLSPVFLQGIGFPLTAWLYLRRRRRSWSYVAARLPSVGDLKWVGGGYLLTFAGIFALGVLVQLLQAPTADRAEGQLFQNPQVLLVMIPLSILFIGPGEELLFRGIIQSSLREVFSAPWAIVLASATFAPAHITALVGSPLALAVTISILFVPSLVFGYAYERTGNLAVPALIHGLYNATLFGLAYLAVTLAPEEASTALSLVGA